MSSHATSSYVNETSETYHRNINRERETVLRIIESAERLRPYPYPESWKDRYRIREIWEVIAIILLLIATHIILALMSWVIVTIYNELIEWIYAIFDLVIAWGNLILSYMSTWVHGFATWKWLW